MGLANRRLIWGVFEQLADRYLTFPSAKNIALLEKFAARQDPEWDEEEEEEGSGKGAD
jgi:hypothetical protein